MYAMYENRRDELHPVDQFMLDLCQIPCVGLRLDLVLTLWDFPRQFESTNQVRRKYIQNCDSRATKLYLNLGLPRQVELVVIITCIYIVVVVRPCGALDECVRL
jgi:hypothetical protein